MKPTQKPRQRQRMKRRMVLILFASFIGVATFVTTIVINTTQVDYSRGQSDKHENYFLVEDQCYTHSFSISTPVLSQRSVPQEGALLCRKMKKIAPGETTK